MGIVKGKAKKKFRSCSNKGFHIKFKNDWIVSIQFGKGNYSENYDLDYNMFELCKNKPDLESDTAEVWCFNNKGDHYPKEPLAYQTPEQVLEVMNKVRKKRK